MAFTPDILIGNANTYQVVDLRDALTQDLETGVEMYMSLCFSPDTGTQVITNAINATPIVITSVAHGLITGDTVTIVNVGGNGAAKGTFVVTKLTNDTFSLNSSVGDGNYTSGGQFYKCLPAAAALPMVDQGDGLYSVDIDGELGLIPQQQYITVYYCLGAYRDIFNDVVRVVARVRGST